MFQSFLSLVLAVTIFIPNSGGSSFISQGNYYLLVSNDGGSVETSSQLTVKIVTIRMLDEKLLKRQN
jgi:hypothetical protein